MAKKDKVAPVNLKKLSTRHLRNLMLIRIFEKLMEVPGVSTRPPDHYASRIGDNELAEELRQRTAE